jgi:hypothetical protein
LASSPTAAAALPNGSTKFCVPADAATVLVTAALAATGAAVVAAVLAAVGAAVVAVEVAAAAKPPTKRVGPERSSPTITAAGRRAKGLR